MRHENQGNIVKNRWRRSGFPAPQPPTERRANLEKPFIPSINRLRLAPGVTWCASDWVVGVS